MRSQIKEIKNKALKDLESAPDIETLEKVEKKYLGRKGLLTNVLRSLGSLSPAKRKEIGKEANNLRRVLDEHFSERKQKLQKQRLVESFDPTEPGTHQILGRAHVLTKTRQKIETFFTSHGFSVVEGPEIETDYYNFEALNIPKDHPARDIWDTFWLKSKSKKNPGLLLRTHTSPMQIRVMEKQKPPLAIIVPGRVFRHEATDARHEHTFDQIEGFYVNENVSAAHLRYIWYELFRFLFGKSVKIQLRPSYFPFTEPSFELFMSCPFCKEKGCAVCGSGWLEMGGSGMIHPKVFEYVGYPKGKYTGFAFGFGLQRIAMQLYGIPDIRMFYQNDLRVIKQF